MSATREEDKAAEDSAETTSPAATATTATSSASATADDGQVVRVRPLSEFPAMATFVTRQTYPALVAPVKKVASLRKKLAKVLLRLPRTKNVYPSTESEAERILVLAHNDALSDPLVQEFLNGDHECRATEYTIELGYDDLTCEDILKRILPIDEVPGAFEAVGHLAHLNLRDECLPYKFWIGKVILDKNQPRTKTVVNKVGSIDNEFRTFGMEVIAGDDGEGWSQVTVKEEGCTFALDFRQVYWNSRLAGEHRRLVALMHKEAKHGAKRLVIADVMAGVGPFAVPLSAHKDRNVAVHANDLNPSSFQYLKINSAKNKCSNLHCYNEDGRAFVHRLSREGIKVDHAIMNLPAIAPEFLDAFRGFAPSRPRIHVHCFAPKESQGTDYQCAVDRCSQALNVALNRETYRVQVRVVRDVSPKKNMLCVSFRLPQAACDLPPISLPKRDNKEEDEPGKEPSTKRQKSQENS